MNEQEIRQQIELCEQNIMEQYPILMRDAAKIGTASTEAASSRTTFRVLIALACTVGLGLVLCILRLSIGFGIILIIAGIFITYKVYDASATVTRSVDNQQKSFYGTLDRYNKL